MIENVSEIVQRQSIEAFQSVIRKSENALKIWPKKGKYVFAGETASCPDHQFICIGMFLGQ